MENDSGFMKEAIRIAREGMMKGDGGPFGSVVVKDGKIVGSSSNMVFATNDPTAHAEVMAIRKAGMTLANADLTGCEIYTIGEPCPMCMAAIYWARIGKVYYANSKEEAAALGFDDSAIYKELQLKKEDRSITIIHQPSDDARKVFREWDRYIDKEDLPQTENQV